ncbi:allantoin permease [Pseudomonas sp.]|uniref:purine-cytosine permease family protein n=1 Tax=Pseudomonas sp. TaxID=306 RepID=UPI00260AE39C|nr:allantoin permease [Pseudomonas sp.]
MAGPIKSNDGAGQPAAVVGFDERINKISLSMAWWAVCSAMFYIIVGGALALEYGTFNAITGMLLSVISYGAITSLMTRHAIKTGHSVTSFSVELFGSKGAVLAAIILGATAIYYAVFEGSVIALAINHLFPSINHTVAALIVVAYSVPLVLGRIQVWLDKLNGVLLPIYVIGLLAAVCISISEYGYSTQWMTFGPSNPSPYGWWNCFVYYMGIWVLMLFAYEYAKFGKPSDAAFHNKWNFSYLFYFVTIVVNGACGIYLVSSVPSIEKISEISVVLAILSLLGFWGLVFVWATQTRINSANYFVATTNLKMIGQFFGLGWKWGWWALVVGILVFVLMLADVFKYLMEALAYQGIIVVAWVGVALSRIIEVRKLADGGVSSTPYKAVNYAGLTAWWVASIVGVILMNCTGLLATFSAPATALVAYSIMRLRPKVKVANNPTISEVN